MLCTSGESCTRPFCCFAQSLHDRRVPGPASSNSRQANSSATANRDEHQAACTQRNTDAPSVEATVALQNSTGDGHTLITQLHRIASTGQSPMASSYTEAASIGATARVGKQRNRRYISMCMSPIPELAPLMPLEHTAVSGAARLPTAGCTPGCCTASHKGSAVVLSSSAGYTAAEDCNVGQLYTAGAMSATGTAAACEAGDSKYSRAVHMQRAGGQCARAKMMLAARRLQAAINTVGAGSVGAPGGAHGSGCN